MYFPKTSAAALGADEFVKNTSSKILACISDTNELIIGVSRESWAASDTTTNQTAVEVPLELWVEWEIDTDSDGGLADTDIFGYRDLDTTGANLDASASTDDVLFVTKKISATKGVVVIAKSAINTPTSSVTI